MSKSPFTVQKRSEWKPESSKFWAKVKSAERPEIEAALRDLLEGADALGNLIVQELPTFTRHDHVHMENVLYWMDQFVTQEGIDELGVTGCALCILLAYVHDLGMLPGRGWAQRVRTHGSKENEALREWAAEHHPELLDLESECIEFKQTDRAKWIGTFLQRDFLRATHATGGDRGRIVEHLGRLDELSLFKNVFAFLGARDTAIKLVAELVESHSRPVDWFAHSRGLAGYKHPGRPDQSNVLLASLLLRLADIADFDCSRTPPIYFRQLGIDGFVPILLSEPNAPALPPEQVGPAEVTAREWMKHLAVEYWLPENGHLVYVAPDCPHPAVEQSIRLFCEEIKRECKDVAKEIARTFPSNGAAWLCLPEDVRCQITPRNYTYFDVSFRLEAHKVTQLLMGTALYGKPELCVRELLQNALDAVQLRDLRCRLQAKMELPYWLPAVADWNTEEREHPIVLEWGTGKDGREWVSVRDAGTGMSRNQIERYFAALGRSFYGSHEFEQQAHLMRDHGLVASPISQFGIGVLSSFMLAESIEIHTCTCASNKAEREAWKVSITGPGSLFHFSPWTAKDIRPGTKVRLRLKRGFRLRDISRNELIEQLRADLGYTKPQTAIAATQSADGVTCFNPAAVAAQHVIWPQYPIVARAAGDSQPLLTLNDKWHFTDLVPLDQNKLLEAARAWKLPETAVCDLKWQPLDWVDNKGPEATGSRVRLVCPLPGKLPTGATVAQLPHWSQLAIAETQLDGCKRVRDRILVRGMHVDRIDQRIASLVRRASAGLGAWLWIDLAGKARPNLTADRESATLPTGQAGRRWERCVHALLDRWFTAQTTALSTSHSQTDNVSFRTALRLGHSPWSETLVPDPPDEIWRLAVLGSDEWHPTDLLDTVAILTRTFDLGRHRLLEGMPSISGKDESIIELQVGLARERNAKPSSGPDLAFNIQRDLLRGFAAEFARKHEHPAVRQLGQALLINYHYEGRLGRILADSLSCMLLNEGFAASFPPLRIPTAIGISQAATHLAPTILKAELPGPSATSSTLITSMSFDLVFPFPAIATPAWQRQFPTWGQERGLRHMLTFPFFVDEKEIGLPVKIAEVLRILRDWGKGRAPHLPDSALMHILIPRLDLWDRDFKLWSTDEWNSCGYSALWNIGNGELLWAVGAVSKGEMSKVGLPLDEFCESHAFYRFREQFPSLFPNQDATLEQPSIPDGTSFNR